MSKPRSAFAHYLVYLAARSVVCVIQALPPAGSRALARGLAWLAYRIDRRHRDVALENLRLALPETTDDARRHSIVRSVYRHFCQLVMDIVLMPRRVHVTNWREHVRLGDERIVHHLLGDRPLMLVTGHFGNWELGGTLMGLLGFRTHAVARPLDNPYLDEYVRRVRERTGQKILAKKGDFDQMTEVLARGGVLATLADQDAGARGQFVDFFGRPASTHKAVALMSMEFNVTLLVIGVRRNPRGMYEVLVEDAILPEEYAGQPGAVREITQRFTTALERLVRRDPEQYFWLHRRWKHQPTPRKVKKAAA